ncbi:MAG: ABC transporter ATP-binding protein, partial [Verrucomicrobia bacterium]|nr:ABC transporter ATP-binding protein [Verrucomicrobiota bacterium]
MNTPSDGPAAGAAAVSAGAAPASKKPAMAADAGPGGAPGGGKKKGGMPGGDGGDPMEGGGMMVMPSEMDSRPLNWGVMFRTGWRLVTAAKWAVLLYCVLYLANGIAPRMTVVLFGKLTSQIPALAGQAENSQVVAEANAAKAQPNPGIARQEAKHTYIYWLVLTIASIVVSILLKLIGVKMDWLMTSALQRQLFEKIIRQSPDFFNKNQPGQLTMTINQLTIEAELTLRTIILEPILQVLLLVGTGVLLLFSFSQVGEGPGIPLIYKLLLLAGALFSPFLVTKLGDTLQGAAAGLRDRSLALSGLVTGVLGSPEEIQALRAEPVFISKHAEAVQRLSDARVRQSGTVETINALNSLPMVVAEAAFLGFALYLALSSRGSANVGAIVAVVGLTPMFMNPVQALASFIIMARTSWPSIDTVTALLDEQNPTVDRPGAQEIAQVEPTLEARDVVFAYRPDLPPIFQGLNFVAPPGKVTGLVARMGQGKSTLFRLALRFYDPQAGGLLVGGRPTTDFTLASLRRHATLMSQFPAFFHDTLRENLRLAKPSASDEELIAVCRRTGMWDILVERLGPNPLEVDFAGGRKLSGGQKKLLALTRCLMRDPSFLFLDEPTAGMDNIEKFHLLPMLREACRGKTVMVIDHDIHWLLRFCD